MINQVEAVSNILEEWESVKARLEKLFRERDQKNASELMKTGIKLYIQFLCWSNEQPVLLEQPINFIHFEFMPVNLQERLGFIMSRPGLYHSYRQLSELMVEQEKLFVKRNILKKASKPKNG